jgi:hypothetical protein
MGMYDNDFSGDMKHFESLYECTAEEFINKYRDQTVIDLTGKVVVSVADWCIEKSNVPLDILGIFVDEGERLGYKSSLIYSGHISFIKVEFNDDTIKYFYKDDECPPMTMEEFYTEECSVMYSWCTEKGKPKEDILTHIENAIRFYHDVNYKLDPNNLYIVEGL